jgi:insertion element IS1 protein InsB
MECKYCKGRCIKKGKYKDVQKYQCGICRKYQRALYRQRRYCGTEQQQVISLSNEGVGISSIGRLLQIPKSTVQMMLFKAGFNKMAPDPAECNQDYEVDELFAFKDRNRLHWYIIYAINRKTRRVIDVVVGQRTKENISRLVTRLLVLSPRRIYTDMLPVYTILIPRSLHRASQYKTNRIERKNLTLRTHLKRLSRKTICYSKSKAMLEACFRLYAWR